MGRSDTLNPAITVTALQLFAADASVPHVYPCHITDPLNNFPDTHPDTSKPFFRWTQVYTPKCGESRHPNHCVALKIISYTSLVKLVKTLSNY